MNKTSNSIFNITVLVAALGYFVDIYDLLLFQIVRVDSLKDMGLSIAQVKSEGEFIISVQMIGLLVGGIIWGVMGDKKGRLSVLFGSIVLYSIANIINGFVQTPNQYALTRFFGGRYRFDWSGSSLFYFSKFQLANLLLYWWRFGLLSFIIENICIREWYVY